MVIIQAPALSIETTTFLPKPNFGNTRNQAVSANFKRAMDGTLYSTVKKTGDNTLSLDFRLTRLKALEVEQFYLLYSDKLIKLTTHDDEVYHGHFIPPFQLVPQSRGEYSDLSFTFEGTKQ